METGVKWSLDEVSKYLEEFLESVKYPATKNDLIEQLRKSREGQSPKMEEGNPVFSEMLRHLGMLPDREYKSRDEVASELGRR